MQNTTTKVTPRQVTIGGLRNGFRHVTDDATGLCVGYVVSDAGPATLGTTELTHVDYASDGFTVGGTIACENGTGLALFDDAKLYRIFPRNPLCPTPHQ